MTGFGQAAGEQGAYSVQVTLRGVNHRFLDIVARLPEDCRSSEAAVQGLVADRISRGRVELAVEVKAGSADRQAMEVRGEIASLFAAAAEDLTARGIGSGDLEIGDLLRLPGVVEAAATSAEWNEEGEELLLRVVGEAMDEFVASRRQEGARLADILNHKLEALGELVARLETLRPAVQSALQDSLRSRLAEMMGEHEVSEERQLQEAAVLVDRSNVSEELERLVVHLEHLREALAQAGAVGKRLDFVVQEIFRELNTTSAKCRSSEMSRVCVDAKVLCEELREQLRNVE